MSLYVGNLSSRVKQEDLGRAFGRFGRCRVQLKDGYGFAIYESRADAERALRTMRGKYVCGEQVTLGWSNRQPRYAQRLEKTGRFYEHFHRRIPREESDAAGLRGSQDRGDFNTGSICLPSYSNERQGLDDALDKKADRMPSDMIDPEGNKDLNDHEQNEAGTNGANLMESDRWGEHGAATLNSRALENGNGLEFYERYDDFRKGENEKMDSPYESRGRGTSREKWRENSIDDNDRKHDKSKPQQACYACGQVGHIMRNCPAAESQRERFSKFSRKREELNFGEKVERGLKRSKTGSWGKSDASRDPVLMTRHKRDRKDSHAGKARRLARTRPSSSREENQPKPKGESKKKSKKEYKNPRKSHRRHRSKRSRTSTPSHSPRIRTRSHSKPRESNSDSSSSHVRSLSSRSSSMSKSSLSRPLSSRSRLRSRSRSRSSSRSLSLSVSLGQKQIKPSKDIKVDSSPDTCFKEHLDEGMSLQLESSKINGECSNMENENPRSSDKANIETSEAVMHPVADSDNTRDSKFMIDLNKNCPLMESDKDANSACRIQEKHAELETTNWNSIRETTSMCDANPSTRLTTKEMFSALRHYGLGASDEGQVNSVQYYFGAACLWPWEMIYYRRSRKGPISTENYARRLQQNKEFGIVDKYIRSSSGWSEVET